MQSMLADTAATFEEQITPGAGPGQAGDRSKTSGRWCSNKASCLAPEGRSGSGLDWCICTLVLLGGKFPAAPL